jgi:putative oxygen-independent coproporphyrinogen III oxidase
MREATVYLHFPWCLEKCPYCDFVSYKAERPAIPHERYADAVLAELEARLATIGEEISSRRFISIFVGGGTPSLWAPASLARVLGALRERLPFVEEPEVTVECNPSSLTEEHARALRSAGVNRLSVGVQSLDDDDLRFLGRLHDAHGATHALEAARKAGFQRLSGDLIYALPNQEPAASLPMAGRLLDLGLTHLSAYQLTIEPGTRFGELAKRGRLPLADEGASADAFLALDAYVEERGLRHYEVSNFARAGEESRHNVGYWRGLEYLALGCGAYGYWRREAAGEPAEGVRYRNEVLPEKYMQHARTMRPGVSFDDVDAPHTCATSAELLDADTLVKERIMLGLRLAEGFDVAAAEEDLATTIRTGARERAVAKMVARERLVVEGPRWRVPKRRWLLVDGTAAELF